VGADGEYLLGARAVIDASGTWTQPNPAGADGLPALGERSASPRLSCQIPDLEDPEPYAGRHTVVVGAGHSALTAVHQLAQVAKDHPGTRVTWVLRRAHASNVFGGGEADRLAERGALGIRARQSVEAGLVQVVTGFRIEELRTSGDAVVAVAEDGRELPAADTVVVLTGFRPDLDSTQQTRRGSRSRSTPTCTRAVTWRQPARRISCTPRSRTSTWSG